jgi:hypothetical protein
LHLAGTSVPTYALQEVIDFENLLSTGDDFADTAECGQTEPFRQRHAIFDLSRDHVAMEVATHRFSANLASALAGPYLLVERCPSFVMSGFGLAEVLPVGDTALVDD